MATSLAEYRLDEGYVETVIVENGGAMVASNRRLDSQD